MTNTTKAVWGRKAVLIHRDSDPPLEVIVSGRARWALECLLAAGEKGCTPIDTPGPRWSHYVWVLREEGIQIETRSEKHGGPFAGTHARYILRSRISNAEDQGEAA